MGSTPNLIQTPHNQETQWLNSFQQSASISNGCGITWRPIFTAGANGSRVHAISVYNPSNRSEYFWLAIGKVLTAAGNIATITKHDTVNGGGGDLDTITRSSGSFVTDGWAVDMQLLIVGSGTQLNNISRAIGGFAVSNTVMQLEATNIFSATDSSPAATTELVAFSVLGSVNLAAATGTQGSTNAVAPTTILNNVNMPFVFPGADDLLTLGPNEILLGYLSYDSTPVPTATSPYGITVFGGDY